MGWLFSFLKSFLVYTQSIGEGFVRRMFQCCPWYLWVWHTLSHSEQILPFVRWFWKNILDNKQTLTKSKKNARMCLNCYFHAADWSSAQNMFLSFQEVSFLSVSPQKSWCMDHVLKPVHLWLFKFAFDHLKRLHVKVSCLLGQEFSCQRVEVVL